MNIQPIEMDPKVARVHYREYRKKVREALDARKREVFERNALTGGENVRRARVEISRMEKEDQELSKAYRAMSLGARIINVPSVLRSAGLNEQKLPKLAICPANAEWCWLDREGQEWRFCRTESWRRKADDQVRVPLSTFSAELSDSAWRQRHNLVQLPVRAMVPSIPVRLRPSSLDNYFILWDAVWEKAPPVDPLLLRKVTDTLYSIVAQWDLTPIERAVLEGRIS